MTGHPLPSILWPDPSRWDAGAPVAVILPNGYAGSIWNKTGTVLAQWVKTRLGQGWLWAAVAYLPDTGSQVEVRHPTYTALVQQFGS